MEHNIDILVIEDEAIIAETIRLQLEDFGYHISNVCYKYETATRAIDKADYDLVITDIDLGNGIHQKSGLDLVNQLKQVKKCPFIFLTAYSDRDTIKKATALNPSAYLVKPVNAVNLYASIQLAVENYQNTQSPAYEQQEQEQEPVPDYFFVKSGNRLIKVFWKEVYSMESVKNYVRIKSSAQTADLLVRASLQQFLKTNLPESFRRLFIKINGSTAIAKTTILKINEDSVETTYGRLEKTVDIREAEL
jgi:two-component system, LytTR family, response regulator LytT